MCSHWLLLFGHSVSFVTVHSNYDGARKVCVGIQKKRNEKAHTQACKACGRKNQTGSNSRECGRQWPYYGGTMSMSMSLTPTSVKSFETTIRDAQLQALQSDPALVSDGQGPGAVCSNRPHTLRSRPICLPTYLPLQHT